MTTTDQTAAGASGAPGPSERPDELPFYLQGAYAPVHHEVEATDLVVQGTIPDGLDGLYVRNGPNPRSGDPGNWFTGDGMLHGIRLRDGKAQWYRNRWVRTKAFAGTGGLVDDQGNVDYSWGVANTNIVSHGGRMLALVESSLPTEVSPDLDTVGVFDFAGKLRHSMTAHPKICPTTGEMHFFGYGFFPPYLMYYVVDAGGALVHAEEITVPGPTMMHDFNLTATSVVFMDLPVVFDLDLAMTGAGMPYRWDDSYGARLGVLPRRGADADTTWYDVDPCYVFHPANVYDDGDRIVIDIPRYAELWATSADEFDASPLWRWSIDTTGGSVTSSQVDERSIEFPRADPRLVGLPYRYQYAVETQSTTGSSGNCLVKYDRSDDSSIVFDFGIDHVPAEVIFVPASTDAAEDEGWLLTFVADVADSSSRFVVLDARDVTAGPVASVALPQRVPLGFHGNWMPDAS